LPQDEEQYTSNGSLIQSPSNREKLIAEKDSNPNAYYGAVAKSISDGIFYNHIKNRSGRSDSLFSALEELKPLNPKVYYETKLGLLGRQMGWDYGENRSDRADSKAEAFKTLIPEAISAGLSADQINTLVGSNINSANSQNQQRIANEAATGGGGFSFTKDVLPGLTFVGSAALGAAGPAAFGLNAAQAAALSAGISGLSSAASGGDFKDILKNAAIAGALSYGLGSLGGDEIARDFDFAPEGMQPGDAIPSFDSTSFDVPDNPYTSQFADAFSNPEISDLPAFEPTASTISSDAPSPDLVSKSAVDAYDPMQASQEGYELPPEYTPFSPEQLQNQYVYQDISEGPLSDIEKLQRQYEAQDLMQQARNAETINQGIKEPSIFDKLMDFPEKAYDYVTETPISEMGSDLYNSIKDNPYKYLAGAVGIAGLAGEGPLAGIGQAIGTAKKPSATPVDSSTQNTEKSNYKYGSAGKMEPNYLLRNRINAQNVYSDATGFRPVTRMADGGEVKHFGLGGLSKGLTKIFQPIEKAVVQPIGQAAPFLKDALPYAGMIAAPFIANPMMAAGVGALTSGMGKGGFNMKRALMGGISAYGMSNLGAGLEAAGGTTPAFGDTGTGFTTGSMDAALNTPDVTNSSFFRNPETMFKGAGNLMAGGNGYDVAAKNFATKAGLPSAGMALLGQSGVSAVNEGIAQQEAYDKSVAASDSAQAVINARNKAGRDRAIAAVRANPYQYAMGGAVNPSDDQTNLPNQTPMQKLDNGGVLNYAMGGYATGGEPRFLSGGGDGMSDSIRANIEGSQEARLADGEFVIPADVVSHLGNGSSKAGAKQLYSMMDRVRQARVGNKKQGKQINPQKLMAA